MTRSVTPWCHVGLGRLERSRLWSLVTGTCALFPEPPTVVLRGEDPNLPQSLMSRPTGRLGFSSPSPGTPPSPRHPRFSISSSDSASSLRSHRPVPPSPVPPLTLSTRVSPLSSVVRPGASWSVPETHPTLGTLPRLVPTLSQTQPRPSQETDAHSLSVPPGPVFVPGVRPPLTLPRPSYYPDLVRRRSFHPPVLPRTSRPLFTLLKSTRIPG